MAGEYKEQSQDGIWFVYDGECPICNHAAQALRIRETVGPLHLVDARGDAGHAVVEEVNARGLDLDAGMVIKFQEQYYHGADALEVMALLGTGVGWFNRMNALLFRSRRTARVCYPFMRGMRNLLLRLKGVANLHNLEKQFSERRIFQSIFGEDWEALPPVMHKHYANRPFSRDVVTVEGTMEVRRSPVARALSPLLRLAGALVPYEGSHIPVTVHFRSEPHSSAYCFDREFRFPGRPTYRFRSKMIPVGGNEVIEYMGLGIGWHAAYRYDCGKVRLLHKGYVWNLLGRPVPVPLALLIGKGYAEEEAISDDTFRMAMETRHPWFGRTYAYSGEFRIALVERHG